MLMRTTLVCALTLVTLTASTASAQVEVFERGGFSGALGIGVGSGGLSCAPACAGNRETALALLLRIGGHISPRLALGIETTLFRAAVSSTKPAGRRDLSWLTLAGAWYPSEGEDYFLKLGLGVGSIRADTEFPGVGPLELTASDFGASLGVGRDFRLSERFAVTAFGDILFTLRSQAALNNANSGAKVSADLVHVGLALTIP